MMGKVCSPVMVCFEAGAMKKIGEVLVDRLDVGHGSSNPPIQKMFRICSDCGRGLFSTIGSFSFRLSARETYSRFIRPFV